MPEYIEREALLKKFYTDTRFGFYGDFTDGSETAYTSAEVNAIIVNAPAADVVEVKHGEWKTQNFIIFDSEKVGYRCSECNTTWDTNTRFCPYCGAKMDGGKNG